MRYRGPSLVVVLLVVAVLVGGCSGVFGAKTTGDLLVQASKEFVSTHQLFRSARAADALTDAEWNAWVQYASRFQLVYDRAYTEWLAGLDTGATRTSLETLLDEILIWTIAARKKG